jgi:hypothetical protein
MVKHKLYLKPDKCEFEQTTVEYLRVIVSHNSISMDLVKIIRVQEWPKPTNKKEVQSFLGFTNFYCQFIKDFSEHARPLEAFSHKVLRSEADAASLAWDFSSCEVHLAIDIESSLRRVSFSFLSDMIA